MSAHDGRRRRSPGRSPSDGPFAHDLRAEGRVRRFATGTSIGSRWSTCGSRRHSKCSRTASLASGNMPWHELAQRLGWPAERVVIIDEDQGQSGKSADNRSGFQRLMTEVSLNHVGIVLGLELSRLSRSNKDWHQLIDVCGIFNTLLCDQDGVYDPLDGNDRLLLGMKGAMSEFELVTLRNRLLRGQPEQGGARRAVPARPAGILQDGLGRGHPGARRAGPRDDPAGLREVRGTRLRVRGLSLPDRERPAPGISPPARGPHRRIGVEDRRRPLGSCRSCGTRSTPAHMPTGCTARGRRTR